MRLLSRLLVVLVTCFIAIVLPAVPAQAQCGGPVVELSPSSGVPGTVVAVAGQFFEAGKYVDIYYDGNLIATGRTDSSGDFAVLFTVPEGCTGAYQVHAKVGAHIGYNTANVNFTVKPGLTVSPEKGPVGTNVTVKGQGFARNEQGIELMYYLNDNYETVKRRIVADDRGSWEMSFPIPQSTMGAHRIDAEGDESKPHDVEDASFEVMPNVSLDKPSGRVGESITMTGSRFIAYEKGIEILFDGQAVVTGIKADAQGYWEAGFKVPEMPTDTYIVTAQGEWTKKEDIITLTFEIEPDIVLPITQVYAGMNLTVTGYGFAANEDLAIMYEDEGNEVATTRTTAQGSFEVSFLLLESQSDEHEVIARDAAGNTATSTLTMESGSPPVPELKSPSNGSWVGIIGKVRPTFEWSAISDPSGVYYSLQIATSDNVTATGEFVHPIISKEGLVATSYTLEEADALPHGTYYWIVQAVDGVENESGWTTARSFRVDILPRWAFIAAIAAIVVLLGVLISFLVRRRRYYYE